MATRTGGEGLDRLERVVQIIAEGQISLQKTVADLATETRRGFDRVAEQFAETDRRMRESDQRMKDTDRRMKETDAHLRQTDERGRQLDERIDKLVLAIGELIRNQHPLGS